MEKSINVYDFFYDKKGRPLITICTSKHPGGIYTRGIAICSELDIKNGTFSKKKGRLIARGRSNKALENKESSNPILQPEVIKVCENAGFPYRGFPKYLLKIQDNVMNVTTDQMQRILNFENKRKEREEQNDN